MNFSLKLCASFLLVGMFAAPTVQAAERHVSTDAVKTVREIVEKPTIMADVDVRNARKFCRQFNRRYGYFPDQCALYFDKEIETQPYKGESISW